MEKKDQAKLNAMVVLLVINSGLVVSHAASSEVCPDGFRPVVRDGQDFCVRTEGIRTGPGTLCVKICPPGQHLAFVNGKCVCLHN
ncbi:hypothetical protein BT93_E1432 [Corymbia citriodora subsp. variegata]|nr:hypothetical protein BT93_E1432 [Corymbia citriodora subsp. variegata]